MRRTQVGKLDWPKHLADYWRQEVTASFPEAMVTGYGHLVGQCGNHEEDHHVLAAAIKAPAHSIVTFNLAHFRPSALQPHTVVAYHPADYLRTLYDIDPADVTSRVHDIAKSRGLEPAEVLRRLHAPLPRFADFMADKLG